MAATSTKLPTFSTEELAIDESLGFPRAYSKLCNPTTSRTCSITPYLHGPPLCFLPYTLHPHEALREKELNQMFPVIDADALPAANPRGFVNLLWKQLDHLGNAGFDPALFRVDPYGNVLYLHADGASPLGWEIDHWFPCSRGGRTVPSNLRLVQWQVCKKKKGKLEFLVPWWDLQLGISVTHFLNIFASNNSDFRTRAFSFLFPDGGSEELNALQTVDSHSFPHHYVEMEQQVGLAPAAIVSTQRNSDSSSVLKPLNINKSHRPTSPFPGAIQRLRSHMSKENEQPETDDYTGNPYFSIARARDSLRQKEECKKQQGEISQLDDELNELKQKNEAERFALQDLEAVLIKKRRRVEKCRRLAEAQSSYKSLLEKMIRDSMHQSVVYKEQLRLNQAATSALMARLEAQRAICDTSENELRRKFKQRDEIERMMRPCWGEQARKRSRMDHTLLEERNEDCIKAWTPSKKELRQFLEEEHQASEAGLSLVGEIQEEEEEEEKKGMKCSKALVVADRDLTESDEDSLENKLMQLAVREGSCSKMNELKKGMKCSKALVVADRDLTESDEDSLENKLMQLAVREGSCSKMNELKKASCEVEEADDDEEHINRVGKGNVEKWLELMMKNAKGSSSSTSESPDRVENEATEMVDKLNQMNPEKEIKYLRLTDKQQTKGGGGFEACESYRGFRSLPSSPSMMMGVRRSVDCLGKMPKVTDENEGNLNVRHIRSSSSSSSSRRFIKSCTKTIRRAVNK